MARNMPASAITGRTSRKSTPGTGKSGMVLTLLRQSTRLVLLPPYPRAAACPVGLGGPPLEPRGSEMDTLLQFAPSVRPLPSIEPEIPEHPPSRHQRRPLRSDRPPETSEPVRVRHQPGPTAKDVVGLQRIRIPVYGHRLRKRGQQRLQRPPMRGSVDDVSGLGQPEPRAFRP